MFSDRIVMLTDIFPRPRSSPLSKEPPIFSRNQELWRKSLIWPRSGLKNIFIGVPVKLGRNGVEKIIELKLSDEEKIMFMKSVNHVRQLVEVTEKFL